MKLYEQIKIRTLFKYPFLGALIAGVPVEEATDPRIKRAATDGKSVFMRREFMESIPPKQQVFVLAHEYLHIAFGHLLRLEGKDMQLWNQATDAVINEMLAADGLEIWPDAIRLQGAQMQTADEVYNLLLKEQREQKQKQQQNNFSGGDSSPSNSGKSGSGSGNQGQNSPSKSGQNNAADSIENSPSKSGQNNAADSVGNGNENEEVNENSGQHGSHIMWKDAVKSYDDEVAQQMYQTAVQRAIAAGNSTTSVARGFEISKNKKPLIPWNYLLRQTIAKNLDWSYKNAELEDYVLTAKLEGLPRAESEILVDTSGSIDEQLINAFLNEVYGMLKDTDVKVGCFDTKFYGFEKFTRRNLGNFKPVGGGGTDFDVAVNAFTKRAVNKIIFTDGYAPMPENSARVIWVVVGQTKIEPKGAKVIYIPEQEIRKMALNSKNNIK